MFFFKGESVEIRKFAQNDKNRLLRYTIDDFTFSSPPLQTSSSSELDFESVNEFKMRIVYKLVSSPGVEEEAIMSKLKAKDRHSNYFNVQSVVMFLKDRIVHLPGDDYRLVLNQESQQMLDEQSITLNSVFPFHDASLFAKLLALKSKDSNSQLLIQSSPKKNSRSASSNTPKSLEFPTDPPSKSKSKKNDADERNTTILHAEIKRMRDEKAVEQQKEAERHRLLAQEAKLAEQRARDAKILHEKHLKESYMAKQNLPRDDLLCDDLKPFTYSLTLPSDERVGDANEISKETVPLLKPLIRSETSCQRISHHHYLMLLELAEFLNTFLPIIDPIFSSYFPQGIDISLLESSVISKNPDSSFGEILQCFLTTLFAMKKEEEGAMANENNFEMLNELDESDVEYYQICEKAVVNRNLSRETYGIEVYNLVIDNCTLSEVLRLHILASGSNYYNATRSNVARQRGCISFRDDAGLEFKARLTSAILHPLDTTLVYELHCEFKIEILNLLMNQIMCCAAFRDYLAENIAASTEIKSKIRQITTNESTLNRIEVNHSQTLKDTQETTATNGAVENPNPSKTPSNNTIPKSESNQMPPSANNIRKDIQNSTIFNSISTRGKPLDPNQLFEKIINDPVQEYTPEKVEYIRECFASEKQQLYTLFAQYHTSFRCLFLGFDRHLNHYVLSPFFQSILVFNSNESVERITRLCDYYLSDSQQLRSYLKQNFAIDLHDSFLLPHKQRLLSQLILDNLQNATQIPAQLSFKLIESKADFRHLLTLLSNHGQREKSLKSSLLFNRDLILSFFDNPKQTREKGEISATSTVSMKPITDRNCSEEFDVSTGDLHIEIEDSGSESRFESVREEGEVKSQENILSGKGLVVNDLLLALVDLNEKVHAGQIMNIGAKIDIAHWIEWFPLAVLDEAVKTNSRLKELMNESEAIAARKQLTNQIDFEYLLGKMKDLLVELAESLDPDFLVEPLGISKNSKKRILQPTKNEKIMIGTTKITIRSHFYTKWLENLKKCNSFSKFALFYTVLENSVSWSRSAINKTCYECRRKVYQAKLGNEETHPSALENASKMLICNICERTYHRGCVRQLQGHLVTNEWFCPKCRSMVICRQSPLKQSRDMQRQASQAMHQSPHNHECNSSKSDSDENFDEIPSRRVKTRKIDERENNPTSFTMVSSKPTRASISAAMEAMSRVIEQLNSLDEVEIIEEASAKDPNKFALTFSEIYQRFCNGQYSRPTQIVDDILLMIDSCRHVFLDNSREGMCLLSFDNQFKDCMNDNELAYFLD